MIRNFHRWAAGFFAAEGCFTWQRDGRNGYHQTPRLDIGQKERALLDRWCDRFGGRVYLDVSSNIWRWVRVGKAMETLHNRLIAEKMDFDWIVGFWEGDGSIVANNGNPATPRVTFSNNNLNRLEKIRKLVGGRIQPTKHGKTANLYLDGSPARMLAHRLLQAVLSPRRRTQLSRHCNFDL